MNKKRYKKPPPGVEPGSPKNRITLPLNYGVI